MVVVGGGYNTDSKFSRGPSVTLSCKKSTFAAWRKDVTYHGGAVERVLELRGYDTVVWEDFVNALPGYGFTVCEDCFNALTFKGLDEDIRFPCGVSWGHIGRGRRWELQSRRENRVYYGNGCRRVSEDLRQKEGIVSKLGKVFLRRNGHDDIYRRRLIYL